MLSKKWIVLMLVTVSQHLYAQSDSLYIWPGVVPGQSKPKAAPTIIHVEDGSTRITDVTNPIMFVFKPKTGKNNNKAIIVCPGGGYVRLAEGYEGYTIAEWLASLGYSTFVLRYRVPNDRAGALQDLQRALKYVRHYAKQFGIDTSKVAAMGFSAGAHLTARAGMGDSSQTYPSQDAIDIHSGRPDRMILIYPAYLDSGPNMSIPSNLKVDSTIVPTFAFETLDDRYGWSAIALASAARTGKANVELHLLPKGGHGYAMKPGNKAAETWPGLLEKWLKDNF
jgi:acetyl esterase/lipase